jgi:D-amino-acid oxidase
MPSNPETRVIMRDGFAVFHETREDPWWAAAVPGFCKAVGAELPAGYADGYAMRLPVADMPIYLGWMERGAIELGAGLIVRSVSVPVT